MNESPYNSPGTKKKHMKNNISESEDTHQKYSQVVLCRSLAQAKILKHTRVTNLDHNIDKKF